MFDIANLNLIASCVQQRAPSPNEFLFKGDRAALKSLQLPPSPVPLCPTDVTVTRSTWATVVCVFILFLRVAGRKCVCARARQLSLRWPITSPSPPPTTTTPPNSIPNSPNHSQVGLTQNELLLLLSSCRGGRRPSQQSRWNEEWRFTQDERVPIACYRSTWERAIMIVCACKRVCHYAGREIANLFVEYHSEVVLLLLLLWIMMWSIIMRLIRN